jgi:hypothetical protein
VTTITEQLAEALREIAALENRCLVHFSEGPDYGQGYSAGSYNAFNQAASIVRPALDAYEASKAPKLVDCPVCGGSGFSGRGTGYDDVCGECGGQKKLPAQGQDIEGLARAMRVLRNASNSIDDEVNKIAALLAVQQKLRA